MRSHLTRLGVGGALLSVVAPLAVIGPADAATTKEFRIITIHGVEPRPDVYVVRGRVRPTYVESPAVVQRKLQGRHRWRGWKDITTTTESRYRARIRPLNREGTVCYRVKIRGDEAFKTSYSQDKVCITTEAAPA